MTLWPLPVREAAQDIFGGSIHAVSGRTHNIIDQRVQHAFKVWSQRYEMNAEQTEYAGVLLAWAMRRGNVSGKPYPYTLKAVANEMERVVNDPSTHESFRRHAGLVDVRDQLTGMLLCHTA